MDSNSNTTLHKFEIDFVEATINISIGDSVYDAVKRIDPDLHIFQGQTKAQINDAEGFTVKGEDTGIAFVCLQGDADVNTVVHEAVHVVNYIIGYYDLAFDTDEDELQAYLTGFVVDRIVDALEQHKQVRLEQNKKPKKKKT